MSVPSIQIGKAGNVPEAQKTPVPVDIPDADWKYLDRARLWTLETDDKHKAAVKVIKLQNQKSLELDLTKAKLSPGEYHLTAYWDWSKFQAKGDISVRPLTDFAGARLEAASQDQLLAKSGKIPVTLQDGDFEFTTKVELKKAGDEFATPEAIPFVLPKGLREGPQSHMDVQINTTDLDAGDYDLLISQQDGKAHPVAIKVLPNPPKFTNLPILANPASAAQHFVLKGERLGLLRKLETPSATLQLGQTARDEKQRDITVQLSGTPSPGSTYAVSAYIKDRTEPLTVDSALKITGPLPVIASSRLSLPAGLSIAVNPGEFPAGSTLTAVLDVKNMEPRSVLTLGCADDLGPETALHIGEQRDKWSLQQLSPDQLFLSYDTSSLPAGCTIQAKVDNPSGSHSQPYTLARILRLPQIEQFAPTTEKTADGKHIYTLTGENLEMIGKAGWDQTTGFEVTELPAPIPGQGQHQLLHIALPDPATPTASLYLWLRGENTGRSTTQSITVPAQAPSQNLMQTPSPASEQTQPPAAPKQ